MAKYRDNLPLLSDTVFLMDGGMETTFMFHEGVDLPCFAGLHRRRRHQRETSRQPETGTVADRLGAPGAKELPRSGPAGLTHGLTLKIETVMVPKWGTNLKPLPPNKAMA